MKRQSLVLIAGLFSFFCHAQNKTTVTPIESPAFLKDRGAGMRTSIFGTYVRKNELVVYPFFEFYADKNYEYKPEELGYTDATDYRSRFRAYEVLIFLGYGFTDWLVMEIEAAVLSSATLHKSSADHSAMPFRLKEKGFGDAQVQFDFRLAKETATRPEINSYFEINFPFQRNRKLIGTQEWEFKLGAGLTRGFSFGTLSIRVAAEYPVEEKKIKPGEYAIEYLKRISPVIRLYGGIEGNEDEVELITEVQLHVSNNIYFKINNAFGLTSKAPGWAPEIGVAFSFYKRDN
jgi:hypothetical protein